MKQNQTLNPIIRTLINADYETTHDAMLNRTLDRIASKRKGVDTSDELWVVEHNDVYTLGQAGKEEHILQRGDTPIIHTDRGGQVTWHGTGQLVLYWLIDLNACGWSVRNLVSHAEQSIEDVLNDALKRSEQHQDTFYAKARQDAPGVYIYSKVEGLPDNDRHIADESVKNDIMLGKIASLGFKIKHGFSYHGIALNLNCDLAAFNAINPCGYAGMQMLRLADFVPLTAQTYEHNQSLEGLDKISDSIAVFDITSTLLKNIISRQQGHIPLRD